MTVTDDHMGIAKTFVDPADDLLQAFPTVLVRAIHLRILISFRRIAPWHGANHSEMTEEAVNTLLSKLRGRSIWRELVPPGLDAYVVEVTNV